MTTLAKLDKEVRDAVDAFNEGERKTQEITKRNSERLLVSVTNYYDECQKEHKDFDDLVPLQDLSSSQQNRVKRSARVAYRHRLITPTRQKSKIGITIGGLEELDRQTDSKAGWEENRKVKRKIESALRNKEELDAADIKQMFNEPKNELLVPKAKKTIHPNRRTMQKRLSKGYKDYDLLGLNEDNPPDVIEIVCKHWLQKYHPDKTGDTSTFQRINQAVEDVRADD